MSHPPKVAVVTGAGRGIGQAFAERLAADGVTVVAVDVQDPGETVDAVRAAGGKGIGHTCDVSDAGAVDELAVRVAAEQGMCDILVNNAGIYPIAAFSALELDTWRRTFAVNVDSMFLTCRAFVPGMRARGWGRIVNMSSNLTNLNVSGFAHYIASKSAVVGLTRALASELGVHGITVNALAPSLVATPGTTQRSEGPGGASQEDERALVVERQAIKKLSTPIDLVGAMSFLVSDDAAFVTGQVLFVDGGTVRGG